MSNRPNKTRQFEQGGDGVHRVAFDSLADAIAAATTPGIAVNDGNGEYAEQRLSTASDAFYNGYDTPGIVAALSNPPAPIIAAVDGIKRRIEATVTPPTICRRRVVRRLDMGDELDPMAWARRDPDGWSEVRRERKAAPIVHIGVNASVHCKRRPADLLYRGAAAAALVDLLTDRGVSVSVTLFSSTRGLEQCRPDDRSVARVLVKAADRPMDVGAMAVALAEIAFFRLVMIGLNIRCARRKVEPCCGWPELLPAADGADFDIVLDSDVLTESGAISVIDGYMARFTAALAA